MTRRGISVGRDDGKFIPLRELVPFLLIPALEKLVVHSLSAAELMRNIFQLGVL